MRDAEFERLKRIGLTGMREKLFAALGKETKAEKKPETPKEREERLKEERKKHNEALLKRLRMKK